jgi:hypothetical protein
MASWSGFWNVVHGDGYALLSPPASRQRRAFRTAIGDAARQPYNRILRGLVVSGVGAILNPTYTRVAAQPDKDGMAVGGGIRGTEIEQSLTNRQLVSGDITTITKDLDTKLSPSPWPVDKSGNGGGGQRGL